MPDSQPCDLCEEIRLGGTAQTGVGASVGRQDGGFSRLIRRTSVVDVLAGLGAVIPGYTLIVPRRHVRSIGELSLPEITHAFDAARVMGRRVTRAFGSSVVIVEHGSSGQDYGPSGACIEHAHMHLFPLDSGTDASRFALPESERVDDVAELSALARRHRNYYYCAWGSSAGYVVADPPLESQHARRIWSEVVGRRDEWDWALFPFMENARLTVTRLRRDDLSCADAHPSLTEAELNETLKAYNSAADWYASRTRTFPEDSSLKAEMDDLAAHTTGPILDAGAGAGRDSVYFANLGRRVIAVDASAALLRHIPVNPKIEVILGDVRALPLETASVGGIWCSAVLLHLGREDAIKALREFFRVLRPGGLAQVSVKEGTGHASSPMASDVELRRHFFFYEGDDLKQLANLACFRVIKTWTEEEVDSAATVQRWVKVLLEKRR
jgi:SAM-dependent methyltransferase/diadenosine tetraphosphate (Ap4A) HIT family hydrolase